LKGGGGVKKNVVRELKTSTQAFLPTAITNSDDKEIEDERINNIDIREDNLRALDLRYVTNFLRDGIVIGTERNLVDF
jgi:hypothetical protein